MNAQQIRSAVLQKLAQFPAGGIAAPFTDGWGAPRLAMAMLGFQGSVSLRLATAADEALLLSWANDPQVRANSFTPEPITRAGHHHWFQQGLKNPNRLLLIAIAPDGCPIGQIRFDRQAPSGQSDPNEAMIDLSLDRCVRGQGLAAELLRLGLLAMKERWGAATQAVAEVLPSNTASNASFAKAGFTAESDLVLAPSLPSRTVNRWRWCPATSS